MEYHNFSSSTSPPQQHIRTIRIAVVGDSGVGKSTLIRKLCYVKPESTNFFDFGANIDMCYHIHDPNRFQSQHQYPTAPILDASITPETTTTPIPPHYELVIIEFVDIPGHKRYQETRESLFHNMDGVLLLFDARNERSRKSVPRWFSELNLINRQHTCFNISFQTSPHLHSGNMGNNVNNNSSLGALSNLYATDPYDHTTDDNDDYDGIESGRGGNNNNNNNNNHNNSGNTHTYPNSRLVDPILSSLLTIPTQVFPLFLIGTVVNGLEPLHFNWIETIPFADLLYVDVNSIEEFISAPNLNTQQPRYHDDDDGQQLPPSSASALSSTPPLPASMSPNDHPFVIMQGLIGQFIDEIIIAKDSAARCNQNIPNTPPTNNTTNTNNNNYNNHFTGNAMTPPTLNNYHHQQEEYIQSSANLATRQYSTNQSNAPNQRTLRQFDDDDIHLLLSRNGPNNNQNNHYHNDTTTGGRGGGGVTNGFKVESLY